MSSIEDARVQRVEQVTIAIVGAISKLRAALSTIDGGHVFTAALMGREGEKRIIAIALNILQEIGIEHKTDRTVRRAIAFKLRGPGIGFTQVDHLER